MFKMVHLFTYILILGLPLQGLIIHLSPRYKFWKETILFICLYILITVLLFVSRKKGYKFNIYINKIDNFILLYIAYIAIRALLSNYILTGFIGFGTYTLYICFYFLIFISFKPQDMIKIFDLIIISMTITASLGLFQKFIDPSFFGLLDMPFYQYVGGVYIARLSSTFGTPLDFGAYLAFVFPFLIARIFITKGFFKQIILIIILMASAINIIYTFTRVSWIQLIVSFLVIFWGLSQKIWSRQNRNILILIIIFLIVSFFINFNNTNSSSLYIRLISIFDWKNDISNTNRIDAWINAINQLDEKSFLFGIGPGMTMNRATSYHNRGIICPESYIIQLLLELGIFALAGFILIYIYFIKQAIALYKNTIIQKKYRLFYLAITATLIGFCVNLVVSLSFNDWSISSIFWCICAFLSIQKKCLRYNTNLIAKLGEKK